MTRKYYLDNLRWLITFIVIPFHVLFLSNSSGLMADIPGLRNSQIVDLIVIYILNPWMMPVMCLVAGISARYSLERRNEKQFFKNRVDKLLVPGTLGVLLWQWLTSLIVILSSDNGVVRSSTSFVDRVIIYLLLAIYGVGPLWVAQVLFLCCCVLLLLRKFDKKEKVYELCGNMNLPVLLSMFLIIWILAVFLNVNESIHALYIYKIGTCLGTFLLGYYAISHERIQELLKKHFLLLSILAAASTALLMLYVFFWTEHIPAPYNSNIAVIWYIWIVALALISAAAKYWNRENAFTKYMSDICYGILIVHYPVLLVLYLLVSSLKLPVFLAQFLLMILTFGCSFVIYQLFRRIPVIRYCMFGFRT